MNIKKLIMLSIFIITNNISSSEAVSKESDKKQNFIIVDNFNPIHASYKNIDHSILLPEGSIDFLVVSAKMVFNDEVGFCVTDVIVDLKDFLNEDGTFKQNNDEIILRIGRFILRTSKPLEYWFKKYHEDPCVIL